MRVGVVLFDAANNIVAGDKTFVSLDFGWASIGGEPAMRIDSIHALSSDVLWVTNLTEDQYYRATLANHANFRHASYLRSSLRHIYSELGVDPQFMRADVVAQVCATVVQRTVDVATSRYGVNSKLDRKTLSEEYAVVMGAPRSQIHNDFYLFFEGVAQHSYSRTLTTNSFVHNSQFLTLRRNRLEHARELLSVPVPPDGQWEYISAKKLPASKTDMESMLEQSTGAFLVNCEVKNVSPMVAEIFSIGSGSRVIRQWLTDVEWRIARQWGDIEYNGMLLCGAPSEVLPHAAKLPSGRHDALSFSLCLSAEQILSAMTMKRGPRDMQRYTAAAAWLRAHDRMVMFKYALDLHGKSLNVWGYGGGNVVIQYPEGGLRHSLDVSTDIGLLAPASKLLEDRRNSGGHGNG